MSLIRIYAVVVLSSTAVSLAGCGGGCAETDLTATPDDSVEALRDPSARVNGAGREHSAEEKPIVLKPSADPDNLEPRWDPAGIADFEFVERSGRKISKSDLLGKPWRKERSDRGTGRD